MNKARDRIPLIETIETIRSQAFVNRHVEILFDFSLAGRSIVHREI